MRDFGGAVPALAFGRFCVDLNQSREVAAQSPHD
jgi:hypothetical protein